MADIKALEYPTLKVPYEILNKKFRSAQKILDREVSHVSLAIGDVEKQLNSLQSDDNIVNSLSLLVDKLYCFKRKAQEAINEEKEVALLCKKRINHLKDSFSNNPTTVAQWKKKRLDRMLVEHFLRSGYYTTASLLAFNANVRDLTNMDIFLMAREIENSLNSHQINKALAWCHENKSRLRKLHSTFEFQLCLQEFIELIKEGKLLEAIMRQFVNLEDDQWKEVQHCMGLLAFSQNTGIQLYKNYLSNNRWQQLISQFRTENCRLYQLSPFSVFSVALQAGLSALKTAQCYRPRSMRNPDCPVCQEPFNTLAHPLPHAHCSHSRLVCYISGETLNEHNRPMALPNGYVYGEKALHKMVETGHLQCPRTSQIFASNEVEKVFVM